MAFSFTDFFPVPRRLEMPAVGVDISDDAIKLVELVRHGTTLHLGRFVSFPLARGIIEKGALVQVDALTEALRELNRQYPFSYAHVSFPEEQGYLVRLVIPSQASDNLRAGIELQIEEHVPLRPEEIIFDYEVVGVPDPQKGTEVSVSVLPQALVDSYVSAFSAAGIEPLAFNVESQASARATVPHEENGTFMVVDFGSSRTVISIVSQHTVWFSSTALIGSTHLTDVLSKEMKITFEEAEREKILHGLSREFAQQEMFSLLAPSISALRDEINKHYYYWQSRKEQKPAVVRPIEAVYFTGGGANLRGLIDYLSYDFEVPVVHANVWNNVPFPTHYVPPMTFQESLGYAPAVGMALFGYNDFLQRTIVL